MNQIKRPLQTSFLKAILLCTIAAVIFLAYADVRHHQFLNFDDNEYVTENTHVNTGLTLPNLRWAFTFTGVSYWHPLTWISHMVDCELFGLKAGRPPHGESGDPYSEFYSSVSYPVENDRLSV